MCGELDPLERVNFFAGKVLTVEDLRAEQEYHRQRSRLHNRCCHGWGVVCGLDVSIDGSQVVVSPGVALDCLGEQLLLSAPGSVALPTSSAGSARSYLLLVFDEQPAEPILFEDETVYGRMLESSRLELASADPAIGHGKRRGRSAPCGKAHGVALVRLRLVRRRWGIDPRYRRRRVP